jgi:tetratricopeptide (TPR) repeat protein
MRLAIIILLALCAVAHATPSTADHAWAAAEAEKDPTKSVPLWEAAGVAYMKVTTTATGAQKATAAQRAMLAWKNAMARDPSAKPAPSRELAFLKALDIYLPLAPAAEHPELLFLKARTLHKRDQFADAIPIFEDIVKRFPREALSEYAANLLLDSLNRTNDFERLTLWVTKMRASRDLLAKRPDLVETLELLHVQTLRKQAQKHEAAGEFLACGQVYREAARSKRIQRKDEALFNAGVCFERAGSNAAAIAAFREAARLKTSLAATARARADKLKP